MTDDPMASPNEQDYAEQGKRKGTVAKPPTVGERLADLGSLFDERAAQYGDNYKHFGKIMMGLFPNGLNLTSESDFCRFGIFMLTIVKASRYAQMFYRGGHADSLDDNAVYSMMLREVDEMFKGEGK